MEVQARQLEQVSVCFAKFKELSPILTARGASYHTKRTIFRACVQSVLTYGIIIIIIIIIRFDNTTAVR